MSDARRSRIRIAFSRIRREGGVCAKCAAPLGAHDRLVQVRLDDRASSPLVVVCGPCADRILT